MNTQGKSHLKILFPTLPPLPSKETKAKRGRPAKTEGGKKYKKKQIPTALREAVWIRKCGRVFEHKCLVRWCPNIMTAYDFQAGHNIPESKGGATNMDNLIPICGRCNNSMGDRYTIDEWNAILGGQMDCFPNPLQKSHETKNLSSANQPPQGAQKVQEEQPRKARWRRYFCF
jgi:hypothetical protein